MKILEMALIATLIIYSSISDGKISTPAPTTSAQPAEPTPAAPPLTTPPPQASEGDVSVVQAEDWLSKIAQKYYSNILAYPAIVAATNAKASSD